MLPHAAYVMLSLINYLEKIRFRLNGGSPRITLCLQQVPYLRIHTGFSRLILLCALPGDMSHFLTACSCFTDCSYAYLAMAAS